MSRLILLTAGVVLTATITMWWLLPPRAREASAVDFALAWPVVRGAYHVHSNRSDGTGTWDEIAMAAQRAGLQFVIVTDHGNGTRAADPPAYRHGVLCLDGVEISTSGGHYVALGMQQSPYPLGGHPREVIEDVQRLGGFGVIAHPGSAKPTLAWSDWDAPFEALEWLNADSEWRDEFVGSLGRMLLTYLLRPVETLGSILDRPAPVLAQWDRLTAARRIPALAGADAHARLGLGRASDPYDDRVLARLPSYEVSFRAFVNHLVLDQPLTGEATRDAALVLAALREGRAFTSIDSLATLGGFQMMVTSGSEVARPGDYLDPVGPVAVEAQIAAPAGTTLTVRRNGDVIYESQTSRLRLDVGREPGAYRIEAMLPSSRPNVADDRRVPWVLTNPVYVGLRERHRAPTPAPQAVLARDPILAQWWEAEASPGSTSTLAAVQLEDGTPALEWGHSLAAGANAQQFAAMQFPTEKGVAPNDRLQLRARSETPRRIWVQLRAPEQGGQRWGRTIYVDQQLRAFDLRFDEFRPLGAVSSPLPPREQITAVLLVADTLNHVPGASGRVWITDLWLAR